MPSHNLLMLNPETTHSLTTATPVTSLFCKQICYPPDEWRRKKPQGRWGHLEESGVWVMKLFGWYAISPSKSKSVCWGQFLFFFEYPASLDEIKQSLVIQIWIWSPGDQELSRERREQDIWGSPWACHLRCRMDIDISLENLTWLCKT